MAFSKPSKFSKASGTLNDFACIGFIDQMNLQEAIFIISHDTRKPFRKYRSLYYDYIKLYANGVINASHIAPQRVFSGLSSSLSMV
jgi:hypothetical protein